MSSPSQHNPTPPLASQDEEPLVDDEHLVDDELDDTAEDPPSPAVYDEFQEIEERARESVRAGGFVPRPTRSQMGPSSYL